MYGGAKGGRPGTKSRPYVFEKQNRSKSNCVHTPDVHPLGRGDPETVHMGLKHIKTTKTTPLSRYTCTPPKDSTVCI